MTEIAVFKVSTRFTSKIKKFAVSPKEVKFFLLSSYVFGNPQVKCFLWWPFGDQLQGRREDFVIEGAYRVYSGIMGTIAPIRTASRALF